MKKAAVIIGSLVFVWIVLAAPGAQAATKCTFYIVHGIPGQDIGKAADLPVDVSFNGAYLVKALKFGKVSAALKLDAGSYGVKVYESGMGPAAAPTPLIQATVVLADNEQASIVLHLTKAAKATLAKFTNDLSKIANANGRIVVHALIAGVDMGYMFTNNKYEHGHPMNTIDLLQNGNKCAMEVGTADGSAYTLEVIESKENAPTLTRKAVSILPNKVQLIYVVGTANTTSIAVITKVIAVK